jgi:hypothetical protein
MFAKDYYLQAVDQLQTELKALKKISVRYSWLRFGVFVVFAGFLFLFFDTHRDYRWLLAAMIPLAAFVIVALKHNRLENNIFFLSSKISVIKTEFLYLEYRFQDQDAGMEFSALNSFLSTDFDLFGKSSVFQYINRSKTPAGKRTLAEELCRQEKDKKLIEDKQNAIRELSEKIDFTHNFLTNIKFINETRQDISVLLNWLKEPHRETKRMRTVALVMSVVNVSWITLAAFGWISWASLALPIAVSLTIVWSSKNSRKDYLTLKANDDIIRKYIDAYSLFENERFEAVHLIDLQSKLESHKSTASESLKSLCSILGAFEFLDYKLLSFILNALFLYDIQVSYFLGKWKTAFRNEAGRWFDAFAHLEALESYATYAFNNMECVVYPEILDDGFQIKAELTGHPLIDPAVRVDNSFSIDGAPSAMIITGANMAGKSTFLRTVAVNLILAVNGAPVVARRFSFTPCDILSSIKVQDSLAKNESYFYAELLRLKDILEHVITQPGTLVILDEILRGTNTRDKQTGSLGFVEKLIRHNALVIIATHDLVIGELEHKYPEIAFNQCFEVELIDDRLSFDYKLKEGISRKLNASILMKKLEIID